MIIGDPRENVRLAGQVIGILGRHIKDPRHAMQILLFAASLVKHSNHIIEDLSKGASEAENYLRGVRDELNTDRAREWLRAAADVGKFDG